MPRKRQILALAAASIFAGQSLAQDAQTADPDLPDLGPIKQKLTELRGLEFKRDVPSAVQSLDDFGNMVTEEMDATFPKEQRAGIVQGLMRLGFLTEPIDFGEEFTNALKTQAAAYYDPKSGRFYYLAVDMPGMTINAVAAHELVHALQDQHYDLKELQNKLEALGKAVPRDDDRILAARYLVEGEATYVQMLFQQPTLVGNKTSQEMIFRTMAEMDVEDMVKMAERQLEMMGDDNPMAEAARAMGDIPPYILYPLNAAYTNGAFFVLRARQRAMEQGDSWQGVADVYSDLPASTEQVMHPERYTLRRDARTEIPLPAVPTLNAAGWTRVDCAIHGEFYLSLMLRQCGVQRGKARQAANGWDGDIYEAFQNAEGDTAIVFASTWDSEDEAREFFEAYLLGTDGKYQDKKVLAGDVETGRVAFDCGEGLGAGYVVLRGREVFAVEGFTQALGALALTELLALPILHID